ncbi:dihydroorotase [Chloropicon primus]|uniref:Dihydroorotase, mitochondrial n=2 Tax=Chloropicon primus TaxID=1764295 RepID=A0A5B8MMM6_9CHLO|nr:dihydroorotase [Chloropicon primus]UPR00858.1 dihydroorotase [Chloropicon primus]|eukprot:QDZ21647.1 dihydroorotase [Chloropicon primus]
MGMMIGKDRVMGPCRAVGHSASSSSSLARRSFSLGSRRSVSAVSATLESRDTDAASSGLDRLVITAPDDWHLHVRDGDVLADVVPHTASEYSRAIIMPNLTPPVTTTRLAEEYKERIRRQVPQGSVFEPLMTLYLTDNMPVDEVYKAKESGILAFKLYPAGATTNSDSGVTDVRNCFEVFKAMEETGVILLVHGEVVDPKIDIFDREKVFIESTLQVILDKFPRLKVVLEHITTKHAVEFLETAPDNVGATVTPQHMLLNRNSLLVGGIKPHFYCLPILKREEHRRAIVDAVTTGAPHFFLGTDSAPHPDRNKLSACGCAGIYSAPMALPIYAQIFEEAGALGNFEKFASINGPAFYDVPRNQHKLELVRETWEVPKSYKFGKDVVVPLGAGTKLNWRVAC